MKKTLLFGLIAAALGFTACSSEDDAIQGENIQKKGMVLNATVEQPAETRATIDNSTANWQFAFAQDDVIKVTNSDVTSGTYYTFTNDGTNFKSTDAESTATAADWFAYFPSNSFNLTGQAGTMEGVANLYALAGTTASATTGAEGLTIPMSAKVAILKIENYKGSIDIQVKTSATDYVTGLTAKSGVAGFDVTTSTTPTTLFTTSTTGDYYVAVPAGVQLSVKDGSTTIKSTKEAGLTAGKYYTLSIGTPLTLTALEDNSTVKINFSNFQYRTTDQTDWTDYTRQSEITVNSGKYVQFRGKPTSTHTYVSQSFTMETGSFDASGNVMSLLYGHEMGNNAFSGLFKNCANLKSASALLLPATTLTSRCYVMMFSNCTSLTTAPELPAENLAYYCYNQMFYKCTSLTAAPELPAENLAENCYCQMFDGCSLTTAPELPAENLARNCYNGMFQNCTLLTSVPATLPATTMAYSCYNSMFRNCTSLETAPTLPAITDGEYRCLYSMFDGCKKLKSVTVNFTSWPSGTGSTGGWLRDAGAEVSGPKTFRCPNNLNMSTRDNDHVPSGWNVVNP